MLLQDLPKDLQEDIDVLKMALGQNVEASRFIPSSIDEDVRAALILLNPEVQFAGRTEACPDLNPDEEAIIRAVATLRAPQGRKRTLLQRLFSQDGTGTV